MPLTFFFSFLLAMLVNSAGFGSAFFRSVFFIPTAISYVIASIVWKMGIFNGGAFGFANMVWYWFDENAPVVAWIGETESALLLAGAGDLSASGFRSAST